MILNQIQHFPPKKQNKNQTSSSSSSHCLRPIIKNKKKGFMSTDCTHQQSPDKTSYVHGSRTLSTKWQKVKTHRRLQPKRWVKKTQRHKTQKKAAVKPARHSGNSLSLSRTEWCDVLNVLLEKIRFYWSSSLCLFVCLFVFTVWFSRFSALCGSQRLLLTSRFSSHIFCFFMFYKFIFSLISLWAAF